MRPVIGLLITAALALGQHHVHVPAGYKMEPWADGRVALVNQDYSCLAVGIYTNPREGGHC